MNNRLLHTPEGVRDIYGKEYAKKLAIEQKLQQAIHCFGYEDIQTPSIEFFDVFSKEIGTTPSKELYKFFDKEGNTLVLRPDFTPSIARCAAKYFMEEKVPLRFSYNGNTFTNTSNLQGKLKEVTQMGAELIGDPSVEADAEVISMVIEALKSAGLTRFQVTIGEVDYFRGLCEEAGLDEDTEKELRSCISGKNFFAAQELLEQKQIPEPYHSILLKLADMFENIESLGAAKALVKNERSLQAIARLEKLKERLEQYGVAEYISFELGMLSKYQYYTGVVFKAYTYGIGDAVVKGGRYDNLLQKFGKNAAAIGFVIVIDDLLEALSRQRVNIDMPASGKTVYYRAGDEADYLAKLSEVITLRKGRDSHRAFPRDHRERGGRSVMSEERYLTFALGKGRLAKKTLELFEQIGITCEEMKDKDTRKLIFVNEEYKLRFFLAKGPDVPTYVEYGAADIGVVGKDTILEENRNVYEVLDLGFGKCRMCVCGPASARELLKHHERIRVASKYPNIAREYFYNKKHQTVDIIKLNGSVELGPLVELSDVIVDIVETGSTLRENGLEVLEEVCPLSARMIVNPVSMQMEADRIRKLVGAIREQLKIQA